MWLLVVLCGLVTCVHGWGPIGHSLVARLAQSQLNPPASDWIRDLIPWEFSGNLSTIASWADTILYPDTNPTGYNNWQWSRELHYINVPDWNCEYVPSRDCPQDRCVEGALNNYSIRLVADYSDNAQAIVQRQQALFFLVHFVGDIHQPLHVGFKGDSGGNNVKGYFLNNINQTNLHSVWDVDIISTHINRDFAGDINLYYEHLQLLMLNHSLLLIDDSDDHFKKWIQESTSYVCGQIYLNSNNVTLNASSNFTLGEEYFDRNWPLVDQRLAQAGYRLASLLNRLTENRPSATVFLDTVTFIVVLGVELAIGIALIVLGICLVNRRRNGK